MWQWKVIQQMWEWPLQGCVTFTEDGLARKNPISTKNNIGRKAITDDQVQTRGVVTIKSWDDKACNIRELTSFCENG